MKLFFLFFIFFCIIFSITVEARRKPPRDYGQLLPAQKPSTTTPTKTTASGPKTTKKPKNASNSGSKPKNKLKIKPKFEEIEQISLS